MDFPPVLIVITFFILSCSGQFSRDQMIQSVSKTRKLPNLDTCGKSAPSVTGTKVVNGNPVQFGEYPWMAAIGYVIEEPEEPKWLCAGSLITDQYVLTAAHCFHPDILQIIYAWKPILVRLGDLDLDASVDDGANPRDFGIDKVNYHDKYDSDTKINDIGLVRLKTKVPISDFIRPICLPPPEYKFRQYVGSYPVLIGWARTVINKTDSETRLLQAEVEIKGTEECKRNWTSNPQIGNVVVDRKIICASIPGKYSCQGDSGGPLMFYRTPQDAANYKGNKFLMGIVSYGLGCKTEGYPGLYTRVSEFMDWIVDNLDI